MPLTFGLNAFEANYDSVDALYKALRAEGHTGSLNDMLYQYGKAASGTGSVDDLIKSTIGSGASITTSTDSLLLEIGDYLLLENGDHLLLE